MKKVEQLRIKYKEFRERGCNKKDAINEAIREVYKNETSWPHVYEDNYEDFSHVYVEDEVLFSDGQVYIKPVEPDYDPPDPEEKHWRDMATFNERFADDVDYDDDRDYGPDIITCGQCGKDVMEDQWEDEQECCSSCADPSKF